MKGDAERFEKLSAAFKLVGAGSRAGMMWRIVGELAPIAGQEIEHFYRYALTKNEDGQPDRLAATRVKNAFPLLMPGALGESGYDDALYRHHCREILQRVLRKKDTRPGTEAECLVALSEASLKAPLERDHALVAFRIAASIFPRQANTFFDPKQKESYAGACAEILLRLRKGLAKKDRVRV